MFRKAFFLTAVVGLLLGCVACLDSDFVISMTDNKFHAPHNADITGSDQIFAGDQVMWRNDGDHTHSAHGALFDTGAVAPASSSPAFEMQNAGTFAYRCDFHRRMKGKLRVAPILAPSGDTVGSTITLVWANSKFGGGAIPAGYMVDAQFKKPGKSKWKSIVEDETSATSGMITTDKKGTYRFRARLQHSTDKKLSSGWSPVVSIKIRPA